MRTSSMPTWRSMSGAGATRRALRGSAGGGRGLPRREHPELPSSLRPIRISSATPCPSRPWPGSPSLRPGRLAPRGIRVNAIAPGLVLRSPGQSEENFEAMHRQTPWDGGSNLTDIVAALRYWSRRGASPVRSCCSIPGQRFLEPGSRRSIPGRVNDEYRTRPRGTRSRQLAGAIARSV